MSELNKTRIDVLPKHEQNEQQTTVKKTILHIAVHIIVFFLWFFLPSTDVSYHFIVSDLIAAIASKVKNIKIDHCTGRNGGEEMKIIINSVKLRCSHTTIFSHNTDFICNFICNCY